MLQPSFFLCLLRLNSSLSLCLSVSLLACLSVCLSVCVSACLSVCLSGPDICGPGTKKVHVIFNYKGKNHLINKDIRCKVSPGKVPL